MARHFVPSVRVDCTCPQANSVCLAILEQSARTESARVTSVNLDTTRARTTPLARVAGLECSARSACRRRTSPASRVRVGLTRPPKVSVKLKDVTTAVLESTALMQALLAPMMAASHARQDGTKKEQEK